MKTSKNKKSKPIQFQTYFKVSSENYVPTLVRQIGSNKLLEDILSSKDPDVCPEHDNIYPIAHHIIFRSESLGQYACFTADYSFGAIGDTNATFIKPTKDLYLIFCTISDDGVDHNTDYHIFISEGNYYRRDEILDRFRNNELTEEIREIVGEDAALFDEMNLAIAHEAKVKASRIVNAFYAIAITTDKKRVLRPVVKAQWGHSDLDIVLSSPLCLATFVDPFHMNDLHLRVSTDNEAELSVEFEITDNYGTGLFSSKRGRVSSGGDCLLVFHHTQSDTLYVVVSKGRNNNRRELLERFRTGDLKSEFCHYFGWGPEFSPEACEEWLESELESNIGDLVT